MTILDTGNTNSQEKLNRITLLIRVYKYYLSNSFSGLVFKNSAFELWIGTNFHLVTDTILNIKYFSQKDSR